MDEQVPEDPKRLRLSIEAHRERQVQSFDATGHEQKKA